MRNNITDACMSYGTAGVAFTIDDVDWMAIGAIILLITRLVRDIPDAYDSVKTRIRKYNKDRERNE